MPDALAVVRGIYDAYRRGDVDAVLKACAPDIDWITSKETLPWSDGQYRGREGVAKYFADFSQYIDGLRLEVDELIDGDDRVVAVGDLFATARASGRDYRARFAQIWTVRDGRAVRLEGIIDTMMIACAINPELDAFIGPAASR